MSQSGQSGEPERAPRVRIPAWLWAAGVALLALVVFTGVQARQARVRLEELRAKIAIEEAVAQTLQMAQERQQSIRALLGAPGTREAVLPPLREDVPPLRVYWNAEHGVLLSAAGVPAPQPGRAFHLWVVREGSGAWNGGSFRPEKGNVLYLYRWPAPGEMDSATHLVITEGDSAAAGQRGERRVWAGELRRR